MRNHQRMTEGCCSFPKICTKWLPRPGVRTQDKEASVGLISKQSSSRFPFPPSVKTNRLKILQRWIPNIKAFPDAAPKSCKLWASYREISSALEKVRPWIDKMAQSDTIKRLKNLNYEVCHQSWSHKYNKDTTAIKDYNCLWLAVFTLFVTATPNKNIQPDLMSNSNFEDRPVTKFGTPEVSWFFDFFSHLILHIFALMFEDTGHSPMLQLCNKGNCNYKNKDIIEHWNRAVLQVRMHILVNRIIRRKLACYLKIK